MSAEELFLVIVVGGAVLALYLRWALGGGRPGGPANLNVLVDRIMDLPQRDQEALEYAVAKLVQHAEKGPTLDELLALFANLTDEQQQAELAELRQSVDQRKGKGPQSDEQMSVLEMARAFRRLPDDEKKEALKMISDVIDEMEPGGGDK